MKMNGPRFWAYVFQMTILTGLVLSFTSCSESSESRNGRHLRKNDDDFQKKSEMQSNFPSKTPHILGSMGSPLTPPSFAPNKMPSLNTSSNSKANSEAGFDVVQIPGSDLVITLTFNSEIEDVDIDSATRTLHIVTEHDVNEYIENTIENDLLIQNEFIRMYLDVKSYSLKSLRNGKDRMKSKIYTSGDFSQMSVSFSWTVMLSHFFDQPDLEQTILISLYTEILKKYATDISDGVTGETVSNYLKKIYDSSNDYTWLKVIDLWAQIMESEDIPSPNQAVKDKKNDESKSNFSFGSVIGIIVLGIGIGCVGLGFVFLVFWRLQRRRNESLSEQDIKNDLWSQIVGASGVGSISRYSIGGLSTAQTISLAGRTLIGHFNPSSSVTSANPDGVSSVLSSLYDTASQLMDAVYFKTAEEETSQKDPRVSQLGQVDLNCREKFNEIDSKIIQSNTQTTGSSSETPYNVFNIEKKISSQSSQKREGANKSNSENNENSISDVPNETRCMVEDESGTYHNEDFYLSHKEKIPPKQSYHEREHSNKSALQNNKQPNYEVPNECPYGFKEEADVYTNGDLSYSMHLKSSCSANEKVHCDTTFADSCVFDRDHDIYLSRTLHENSSGPKGDKSLAQLDPLNSNLLNKIPCDLQAKNIKYVCESSHERSLASQQLDVVKFQERKSRSENDSRKYQTIPGSQESTIFANQIPLVGDRFHSNRISSDLQTSTFHESINALELISDRHIHNEVHLSNQSYDNGRIYKDEVSPLKHELKSTISGRNVNFSHSHADDTLIDNDITATQDAIRKTLAKNNASKATSQDNSSLQQIDLGPIYKETENKEDESRFTQIHSTAKDVPQYDQDQSDINTNQFHETKDESDMSRSQSVIKTFYNSSGRKMYAYDSPRGTYFSREKDHETKMTRSDFITVNDSSNDTDSRELYDGTRQIQSTYYDYEQSTYKNPTYWCATQNDNCSVESSSSESSRYT